MKRLDKRQGFTLIELSIVLVIIGLIAGGVLVGSDLIRSAGERAQITQIEKYQQAVNTFRGKYNALPGDMDPVTAAQFGFASRGKYAGEGDGNGILEGVSSNAAGKNGGVWIGMGETITFWSDLTYANGMKINLIDGNFNCSCEATSPGYVTGSGLARYFPAAKIGGGNSVYVYSGGWQITALLQGQGDGVNYFGIASIELINVTGIVSDPAMTVKQAYDIDRKVDDGLPQSGRVLALYMGNTIQWAAGMSDGESGDFSNYPSWGPVVPADNDANPGDPGTCYDNGNNPNVPMMYSMKQNNGSGVNCALSFKFQ